MWVNALRSGEYNQTKERLRKGENFCCLGVLCDLHFVEVGELGWLEATSNYDDHYKYHGFSGELPDVVLSWSGLERSNPYLDYENEARMISELNDDYDLSFEQLAQLIEEQL
jgi:hypothetical protein